MNSLEIFQSWLFACSIKPSMLLLVSNRRAICTSGRFVFFGRGVDSPAPVASETASAIAVSDVVKYDLVFIWVESVVSCVLLGFFVKRAVQKELQLPPARTKM